MPPAMPASRPPASRWWAASAWWATPTSAPTSGTYAGVLIFQARDNSRALAFSGNASGSNGILYAANARLVLNGNATWPHLSAVVSTLSLGGGAFQLSDGTTSDYVSST